MAKRNIICDACSHPTGKPAKYGLVLCGVCKIVEEESENGTVIYIQTIGEKEKFVKLLPKRK